MAQVYLGLGSSLNREQHIRAGVNALTDLLGELRLSPVYETEPVGFEGENFFNLVAGADTDMSVGALNQAIKAIEDRHGRQRGGSKFIPCTLDIDILAYADWVGVWEGVCLPRDDILTKAFVLLPLAQIAPGELHPRLQISYAQLWAEFAGKENQLLWPISFGW